MAYVSVRTFAERFGVPERTVRNWCASGKIEGAYLVGNTWNIPEDARLPEKKTAGQKDGKVKGGIYHRTQIDLTSNSDHIEGGRLTHDQTRYIFETNTIGVTDESVNVDDIIETTNHFRCIDMIVVGNDLARHSSKKSI